MAIEVHNAAAPVADDAVFGLPKWGAESGCAEAGKLDDTADRMCMPLRRERGEGEELPSDVEGDVVPWLDNGGGGGRRGGVGGISEPRIIQWRAEGGLRRR
jgi:hypothetical protein